MFLTGEDSGATGRTDPDQQEPDLYSSQSLLYPHSPSRYKNMKTVDKKILLFVAFINKFRKKRKLD